MGFFRPDRPSNPTLSAKFDPEDVGYLTSPGFFYIENAE